MISINFLTDRIVATIFGLIFFCSIPLARAQVNGDIPIQFTQASSEIWPSNNLKDGNTGTLWSSNTAGSNHTEWIAYWFDGFYDVNYIKMRPRFYGTSLGFPRQFTVYWSDGSAWHTIFVKSNYPSPARDEWIILPLPATVHANGIHIVGNILGKDDVNNYVFQLAEAGAGYDAGFEHFKFAGTDTNTAFPMHNEIHKVGSDDFDPAKISHWNYDYRRPLIAAKAGTYRNIYAPSIVKNYGTWNIYFGGWDGSSEQKDSISVVTTADDFQTFSSHQLQINYGTYNHVNNGSAIKLNDSDWRMYYTTAWNEYGTNKPAVAFSSDGASWIPSGGFIGYRISMNGYSDWDHADVNGANVIYYENGTYYLYFVNFNNWAGIPYATSQDGLTFQYQGLTSNDQLIVNDVKLFQHGSTKHYMAVYHNDGHSLYFSTSASPIQFPSAQLLLSNLDGADNFITSIGLVSDGKRLYGALYGASPDPQEILEHHGIYAAWLQKKVIFENSYVRFGDIEQARGPDDIIMYMSTGVETGRYYVYDTDGQTLLYTSPLLTIQTGDNWTFVP